MAAGGLLVGALVAVALAAPGVQDGKRRDADREQRRSAAVRVQEARRLTADQRPRRAAVPAGAAAVGALERAITADARARVDRGLLPPPRPRGTECTPQAADSSESAARAVRAGGFLLRCVAVTSAGKSTVNGRRFVIGFRFAAVIDEGRRTSTWCKTNPPPGEGTGGVVLADVPLARACFAVGR